MHGNQDNQLIKYQPTIKHFQRKISKSKIKNITNMTKKNGKN